MIWEVAEGHEGEVHGGEVHYEGEDHDGEVPEAEGCEGGLVAHEGEAGESEVREGDGEVHAGELDSKGSRDGGAEGHAAPFAKTTCFRSDVDSACGRCWHTDCLTGWVRVTGARNYQAKCPQPSSPFVLASR